jgi:hypothetical protein
LLARRLRVFAFDVFFLGTAIVSRDFLVSRFGSGVGAGRRGDALRQQTGTV